MANLEGTTVSTGYLASASSHTVSLPTGIQAGELLCIYCHTSEDNRKALATGFTGLDFTFTTAASTSHTLLWKAATGSEGASVSVTFTAGGSAALVAHAFRLSGVDTTDPFNTNNATSQTDGTSSTTSTWAAGSLTSSAGNGFLVGIGCEANRSVTAFDSDLSLIGNTAGTNSCHVYYDPDEAGTSNPQYDITFNSARQFNRTLIELNNVSTGLTLDSTPTDLNSQTQESSVVSNAATAPTTGNTEVKFDNDLGPAATVNSVTGSDPYTLNYTFPRTTTKLFSATGYPLYHEVDAENVTSGNVPYLPASGQTYIDLVTPVNTAGTLGETYAGSPAATDDQWVYDTNLTGDASITLTVDAQGYWTLSGTPSVTSTASFYRIDSTGTVDVEDTITFTVGGPTSGREIASAIVSNIVSNIVSEV